MELKEQTLSIQNNKNEGIKISSGSDVKQPECTFISLQCDLDISHY